jgi:hypothetical protein
MSRPLYLRGSNIVKQGFKKQTSLCKRDYNTVLMSETQCEAGEQASVRVAMYQGLNISYQHCEAVTTYK